MSNRDNNNSAADIGVPCFLLGLLLGGIFSGLLFGFMVDAIWQNDAIRHRAGQYTSIPPNNLVKFYWNDELEEDKNIEIDNKKYDVK